MTTLTPSDIEQLSIEERLRLIDLLWETIRSEPHSIPVTPVQQAELERRLDDYQRNPENVISWEQVKKQLRRRG